MKKKIILLILCMGLATTFIACGGESGTKDGGTEKNEVVEEEEINKDILAVAEADEQFNTDSIIEKANNRMKMSPEFYVGSQVPKIDSCVTGIVYDDANSKDGNYIYFFGKALGLTYELNKGEMSYIYDGDKALATFMVFNTEEDGFMMIISPE